VTINEMFGQTEMNYIVGNSHTLWPVKPGSMGRPYPDIASSHWTTRACRCARRNG
jgi:acyl-coenzyme A synthetase/AMP-(fatty) acid ligase